MRWIKSGTGKRRAAAAVLALSLFAGLTGCGKDSAGTTAAGTEAPTAATESVTTEAATTETATETATTETTTETNTGKSDKMLPDVTIPEIKMEAKAVPDTEAFQYVRGMKIGVSLGNTFDAFKDTGLSNEMDTETAWVSIKTSRSMIQAFHKAGFETIRIPVSWHNHVDGDYNISEQWAARVNEVVDWAIEDGMHVILNIHHDNHEEANGFYPDKAHLEQSRKYVKRIWEQLAERYKDYDDKLIFESLNEPRLVGNQYEWWFPAGNAEVKEATECINELNQLFVDTVRGTGGNNATRYLMCPGYDASCDGALHPDYKVPQDTAEMEGKHHIMVSVHAYTPYSFALDLNGTSYFSWEKESSTKDIDSFMDRLYNRFVVKEIPVVIGEFGALDKKGNLQERVDFSAYYIAAAKSRGMTALWWDNNAFSGNGENFGLLYRMGGYFIYEDIVNALMMYAE